MMSVKSARLGAFRTDEAASPPKAARHSLERAGDARCNPATVKTAGLRRDLLTVDAAEIKRRCVEGDMIAQGSKRGCRVGVAPADAGQNGIPDNHIPIRRGALPLAI